jgi:hypothetical protein
VYYEAIAVQIRSLDKKRDWFTSSVPAQDAFTALFSPLE